LQSVIVTLQDQMSVFLCISSDVGWPSEIIWKVS